MRALVSGLLIGALALASPVVAADKAPILLTIADLDPAKVLPPPPATGSPQSLAEIAELRAIERVRSPSDEAAALRDDETKDGSIFAVAIGPGFDLARLPATAHLLDLVRASQKDAANRAKAVFKRQRPYIIDPTFKSCKRNDEPFSSYPSGHVSMAFAMGETLARLLPDRAPAILARAEEYAQSRIVCEEHFRSDVSAGQLLGTLVAERLRSKPTFQQAFDAARLEMTKGT